jgi:hypothetical protein
LLRGEDDRILIDKQITIFIAIGFDGSKLMYGGLVVGTILNNPLIEINIPLIRLVLGWIQSHNANNVLYYL